MTTSEVLTDGTVARIAALAARGEVSDPVLAVRCSVEFLVLPDHVRGACPAPVRATLDAHAWKIAGHASDRHSITAAGVAPSRWLDDLTTELADIDTRTFHELLALSQQALQDLLVKAGMKVRDSLKAAGSEPPVMELAEIPAWATRCRTMTAAVSAKHAELIVAAANELVRRAKRVVAAAIEATAVVMAANLSAKAATDYRDNADERVTAATAALAASFTAAAQQRLESGSADDQLPVSAWFPAGAIWAAMTVAGSKGSTTTADGAGIAFGPLGASVVASTLADVGRAGASDPSNSGVPEEAMNIGLALALGRVRFGIRRIWEHRTGHNYFDPHKSLNGSPAEPEDRFVHYNSWPPGGKYRPGDHAGCRCRWRHEPFLELIGVNNG